MSKPAQSDFLITDPLSQEDVLESVPDGVDMVDLDNVPYRAEPQVHCAFCKQKRLHNDGYFAILSNGMRAPCGNCCAANFDSVKKRTIDKSRNRLRRERADRERLTSISVGLNEWRKIAEFAEQTLPAGTAAAFVLGNVLSQDAVEDLRSHGVVGLEIVDGCDARVEFVKKVVDAIGWQEGLSRRKYEDFLKLKNEAAFELQSAVGFLYVYNEFFSSRNLTTLQNWAVRIGPKFDVKQLKVKNNELRAKGLDVWKNIPLPNLDFPEIVTNFHSRQ